MTTNRNPDLLEAPVISEQRALDITPKGGWIEALTEEICRVCDGPRIFALAAAAAAFSSALPGGLFVWHGGRVHPNLFVLLVGESGSSRRTTIMREAARAASLYRLGDRGLRQLDDWAMIEAADGGDAAVLAAASPWIWSALRRRLVSTRFLVFAGKREREYGIPPLPGFRHQELAADLASRTNAMRSVPSSGLTAEAKVLWSERVTAWEERAGMSHAAAARARLEAVKVALAYAADAGGACGPSECPITAESLSGACSLVEAHLDSLAWLEAEVPNDHRL